MTVQEFTEAIHQMKSGAVPKRMAFIWKDPVTQLEKVLTGIEIHHQDLADAASIGESGMNDPQYLLETKLKDICKKYEETRNEPSTLVLQNAVLLVRYGCDVSAVLRYGISPRSAVILLMPQETHQHFPPQTDGWVKRNTKELILKMAKQLGTPNCIIDV
jgi:hypothetical protein